MNLEEEARKRIYSKKKGRYWKGSFKQQNQTKSGKIFLRPVHMCRFLEKTECFPKKKNLPFEVNFKLPLMDKN